MPSNVESASASRSPAATGSTSGSISPLRSSTPSPSVAGTLSAVASQSTAFTPSPSQSGSTSGSISPLRSSTPSPSVAGTLSTVASQSTAFTPSPSPSPQATTSGVPEPVIFYSLLLRNPPSANGPTGTLATSCARNGPNAPPSGFSATNCWNPLPSLPVQALLMNAMSYSLALKPYSDIALREASPVFESDLLVRNVAGGGLL